MGDKTPTAYIPAYIATDLAQSRGKTLTTETLSPRGAAILSALQGTYGGGTMVADCARTIDKRWDEWESGEGRTRHGESIDYAVHMEIWNWFAGGGTAKNAADRVVQAVLDFERVSDPQRKVGE